MITLARNDSLDLLKFEHSIFHSQVVKTKSRVKSLSLRSFTESIQKRLDVRVNNTDFSFKDSLTAKKRLVSMVIRYNSK